MKPCSIVCHFLLAAMVVGCAAKPAGRSKLTTRIGDREVKASVEGAGFISNQGDAAVIMSGAGKLVVEKGSVQLDGKEVAKLPVMAKKVEVDYTARTLTVTADGTSVFSTEIKK